jgi:DNA polymerase elongation subunit (family B)
MNSDYGAGGSPITYFYNLYCAVSTTATGQSMISTAMCCFEDFFSDNVKFIDFDDCSQYITNVINEPFNGDMSLVEDKKAHEVFERLQSKFLDYKSNYNHPLFSMLLNLDQDNLNRLYYKNNLYGFARLPKVKKLLFKIIDESDLFLDPNKPPKDIQDDLDLLWSWIEEFVCYNYFAFNRIGRLTCDERDTVCTIDTDSNMLCLAPWVDFMFDEVIKNDEKIINSTKLTYTYNINGRDMTFDGEKMLIYKITNLITFIASQVIAKHLKKFSINSGIPEMYHDRIHMKSEFLFRRMILTSTKKRYMSKVMLREGTVFEKTDNKGLDHLKSECNDFTRNFITNLMTKEVLENPSEEIVVKNVVNGVRELAETVRTSLEKGEKTFLTPKKCKEAAAYKMPFQEQSFRGAYAWNMLFPDMGIEFPDTVDIVHLNIYKLEDVEGLKETYPEIYDRIKRFIFESKLEEVRKKAMTVLAIPKNIETIPEWCRPYINYDKIVNDNTTKMRALLESLGIQTIQTDSTTDRYSNIIEF